MQVGIDSFAAAFDENSRAVNPAERCDNSCSRSSTLTRWDWTRSESANTIAVSFWIPRRPLFLAPRRHGRSTSG